MERFKKTLSSLLLAIFMITSSAYSYDFTIKNCLDETIAVNLHGRSDFCKSAYFKEIQPGQTQTHSIPGSTFFGGSGCCAESLHIYAKTWNKSLDIQTGSSSEYKLCSDTTIYILNVTDSNGQNKRPIATIKTASADASPTLTC